MTIQATETDSDIEAKIIETLAHTPYACSTIERLNGGYINFTYRGTILCPLEDGSTSVIIKHGEEYSPKVQRFAASTIRCEAEQSIIRHVNQTSLQHFIYNNIFVGAPRLYHFFPQSNTQVMEDITNSKTLHDALQSLSLSSVISIGQALGRWLASFHSWARSQADADIPTALRGNSEVYDRQIRLICHRISSQCGDERLSQRARDSLLEVDHEDFGVIHGDFTCRNVLVQNFDSKNDQPIRLAIVDWETCEYGKQSRDIAYFFATLYAAHHFNDVEVVVPMLPMLQAFVQGYGSLSEQQAFRVVVQTGMCFFLWDFHYPGKQNEEKGKDLVELAESLLVSGCEKDREWLEHSFLGCLFDVVDR